MRKMIQWVMARGTIYNIKVKQGKTQASATTVVSTAEAEVTLVEKKR